MIIGRVDFSRSVVYPSQGGQTKIFTLYLLDLFFCIKGICFFTTKLCSFARWTRYDFLTAWTNIPNHIGYSTSRWGQCRAYANCYLDGGYGDGPCADGYGICCLHQSGKIGYGITSNFLMREGWGIYLYSILPGISSLFVRSGMDTRPVAISISLGKGWIWLVILCIIIQVMYILCIQNLFSLHQPGQGRIRHLLTPSVRSLSGGGEDIASGNQGWIRNLLPSSGRSMSDMSSATSITKKLDTASAASRDGQFIQRNKIQEVALRFILLVIPRNMWILPVAQHLVHPEPRLPLGLRHNLQHLRLHHQKVSGWCLPNQVDCSTEIIINT